MREPATDERLGIMSHDTPTDTDLDEIRERVRQKRLDYIEYDFSRKKNDTLKTFFDLAQEYDTLPDLFRICVAVPLESFGVDSRLYLYNPESECYELVCDSRQGLSSPPTPAPAHVHRSKEPYSADDRYLVPVLSRAPLHEVVESRPLETDVIGIFEVFPLSSLRESDKFFFLKYANRIGYNLRKKILAQQNIRHLQFIQSLVSDIEHNVIVPNMYYRHLFNNLKKKIAALNSLSDEVDAYRRRAASGEHHAMCGQVIDRLQAIKDDLVGVYEDIDRHHMNLSLFLESLFRRDHFEKGRFVLRRKPYRIERDIIIPQLEHFAKRLAARNITVEAPPPMPEDLIVRVDFGLFSQVYANLFSNALKYTEPVPAAGGPRKALAYGYERLADFYGSAHGLKLNVFTTGPHIAPERAERLFADGFTAHRDKQDAFSSGHGLSFVKYVVELHGGQVGYEPTEQGNNFFFILPLEPLAEQAAEG